MSKTLLIQSSARQAGSVTRQLAEKLADGLGNPVTTRDVSSGLPFVSEAWVSARDAGVSGEVMATSNELIEELRSHDTIVIAAPVYNFSIPATLKAWIDQVARAGETFRYTAAGPQGLLGGKKAYVVVASGGMPVGSAWDFATPYLRHMLGFIGISDVEFVVADALGNDADKSLEAANAQIAALTRAA